MNIVDANLLLYAYDESSQHHKAAKEWWVSQLKHHAPVGIPWLTVGAFLRITTNRALRRPLNATEAADIVSDWFSFPQVIALSPGPQFWPLCRDLIIEYQVSGALMTDAQLAALALEWGGRVCTHDLDFKRFDRVPVVYPLRD